MQLIDLNAYRGRDVREAALTLFSLAEMGKLKGFQFSAEIEGRRAPVIGLAGTYLRSPEHALVAVVQTKARLLELLEEESGGATFPPDGFRKSG
jgi:hypothetical protein